MSLSDWFGGGGSVTSDLTNDNNPWWWTGTGSIPQPMSGLEVNGTVAMTYSAVTAATRVIAENFASLPAVVYEMLDDERRERLKDSQWWRLLHDKPNPELDSYTFYEMQTARLLNAGNAYAEIERNARDEIVSFWPIHPCRVRPWRRTDGALEYHISYSSDPLEPRRWEDGYWVIQSRNMLNVVGHGSEDGIRAPGVIPRARESIGLGLQTERYGASFFGSGARPPGVLEHPGVIRDPEVRANIRREWNEIHQGNGKWQEVAVLWEGMKYKEIGIAPEQAQFLATRRYNAQVIAQWYGIAPAMIGDFTDSKFASVDAQLRHFVIFTLRPLAVRWERAIDCQIFGADTAAFLEFGLQALLRGDPKTQAESNEIKFRNGVLTIDEWRAQENMNPHPNEVGRTHFMRMDLAPVERQAAQTAELPAASESQRVDARELATRVINRSLERLAAQESKTLVEMASKPDEFLAKAEAFYDRWRLKIERAIAEPVELAGLTIDAAEIAAEYCADRWQAVLAAAECPAADLSDRVAEVTAQAKEVEPCSIT